MSNSTKNCPKIPNETRKNIIVTKTDICTYVWWGVEPAQLCFHRSDGARTIHSPTLSPPIYADYRPETSSKPQSCWARQLATTTRTTNISENGSQKQKNTRTPDIPIQLVRSNPEIEAEHGYGALKHWWRFLWMGTSPVGTVLVHKIRDPINYKNAAKCKHAAKQLFFCEWELVPWERFRYTKFGGPINCKKAAKCKNAAKWLMFVNGN